MIDSCLQFEIDGDTAKLGKRLGFEDLSNISNFKILKKYDKDSLLSSIKSLNYDLMLNLEDNPKYFGEGLARLAGEKKVGALFLFNKLLNATPLERSKLMKNMKTLTNSCLRHNVPVVISSGASNKMEMRGKSELLAFASLLGMNGKQAKDTLEKNPQNYLHKEKLLYE